MQHFNMHRKPPEQREIDYAFHCLKSECRLRSRQAFAFIVLYLVFTGSFVVSGWLSIVAAFTQSGPTISSYIAEKASFLNFEFIKDLSILMIMATMVALIAVLSRMTVVTCKLQSLQPMDPVDFINLACKISQYPKVKAYVDAVRSLNCSRSIARGEYKMLMKFGPTKWRVFPRFAQSSIN